MSERMEIIQVDSDTNSEDYSDTGIDQECEDYISPLVLDEIDIEIMDTDSNNPEISGTENKAESCIIDVKQNPESSEVKESPKVIDNLLPNSDEYVKPLLKVDVKEDDVEIEWNDPEQVIRQRVGKEGYEVDSKSNLFACSTCSYKFYMQGHLVRHMRRCHKNDQMVPFGNALTCPKCLKTYTREYPFKRHIKRFSCKVCKKQIEFKCVFDKHIPSHWTKFKQSCSYRWCKFKASTQKEISDHEKQRHKSKKRTTTVDNE